MLSRDDKSVSHVSLGHSNRFFFLASLFMLMRSIWNIFSDLNHKKLANRISLGLDTREFHSEGLVNVKNVTVQPSSPPTSFVFFVFLMKNQFSFKTRKSVGLYELSVFLCPKLKTLCCMFLFFSDVSNQIINPASWNEYVYPYVEMQKIFFICQWCHTSHFLVYSEKIKTLCSHLRQNYCV